MRLPLCMVPGGTSGALAFNCGIPNAATGAYAVCKAHVHALDIYSVVQPPARRFFSFLSLTYGAIPNLDVGTEHLRCALLDCEPGRSHGIDSCQEQWHAGQPSRAGGHPSGAYVLLHAPLMQGSEARSTLPRICSTLRQQHHLQVAGLCAIHGRGCA